MPERVFHMCTGCGDCCRWEGYVHVNDKEIDAIADYLNMDLQEFIGKYTELTKNRSGLTLIEKPNGHCIFFNNDSNSCAIYPVRPKQCVGFPNTWTIDDLEEKCPAIAFKYKIKKLPSRHLDDDD